MNLQQRVRAIGLIAGPVLALVAYFALPVEYADAAGKTVSLGHATRATLAMMVWMATWWMTEAVEIEVTSLLPILAALAPVLGVPPALLLLPATIAASCAFMMPVGTPPNAIVFGTGLVRMPQMIKAGFWLNVSGIVLITALTYLLIAPLLLAR
jgi:sodium-dependent dicarboxylate transporter 2/3/5